MAVEYVLLISKPGLGKNVDACTPDELAFDSRRDCLKVPLNGVGTANENTNVYHGLPYVPIFFACERYTESSEDRVKVVGTYNGVKCYSTMMTVPIGVNVKYYFFYKQGA